MKATAEIVDFQEELMATKASGSGGGYDHFPGMEIGTRFCCLPNGRTSSDCEEYILASKQGITVLLQDVYFQKMQRHIGVRFWKQNTLVQILHIPEKKEQENGTSA